MKKEAKIRSILKTDVEHTTQNNAFCFIAGDRTPQLTAGSGMLGRLLNATKKYGKLYYSLRKFFSPVFPSLAFRKTTRAYVNNYTENHVIINIGCGPQYFLGRTDIINVDLFAFDEVDIIADAEDLPIESQSADLIINMAALEHVEDPLRAVREMHRILKPEGQVIAYAPFIQPFHAAPHDYYRWTHRGLKKLFSNFDTVNVVVGCGPTSGMLYVLEEWLATLLSFGNRALHDVWFVFFVALLFPLKYLDLLIDRFEFSLNLASGFGIFAQKDPNA